MPNIVIPITMDAQFLATLAGLGGAWGASGAGSSPMAGWGTSVEANTQTFSCMAQNLVQVDEAIAAYPAAYLTYRKNKKLEALADIRRQKEMIGPNGFYLDDKTVARLTAAAVGLMLDPDRVDVRWEVARGSFMTFPRTTVLGLAVAAVNHVQACFDAVFDHTQTIKPIELDPTAEDAYADMEAKLVVLEAIDLTSGWPA